MVTAEKGDTENKTSVTAWVIFGSSCEMHF